MIRSFACAETEKIWNEQNSRRFPPEIQRTALRKLIMIHSANRIDRLRVPPANRLEKLRGNREGQYSIRINQQWRICFIWHEGDAYDVEIVDYH
jgi:proteic killer suppression protein